MQRLARGQAAGPSFRPLRFGTLLQGGIAFAVPRRAARLVLPARQAGRPSRTRPTGAWLLCAAVAFLLVGGWFDAPTVARAQQQDTPCSAPTGRHMRLEPSGFTFSATFFNPAWGVNNSATSLCDYRGRSPGLGQGVHYGSDEAAVSFFVYDNGLTGRSLDDALALKELRHAVEGLYAAKAQGQYTEITPLDLLGKPVESPQPASMPANGSTLYVCRFRMAPPRGKPVNSTVMVMVKDGWFLKCRVTSAERFGHTNELLAEAIQRMKTLARDKG